MGDQLKGEVRVGAESLELLEQCGVFLIPLPSCDDGGDHETCGIACCGHLFRSLKACLEAWGGVFKISDYPRSSTFKNCVFWEAFVDIVAGQLQNLSLVDIDTDVGVAAQVGPSILFLFQSDPVA